MSVVAEDPRPGAENSTQSAEADIRTASVVSSETTSSSSSFSSGFDSAAVTASAAPASNTQSASVLHEERDSEDIPWANTSDFDSTVPATQTDVRMAYGGLSNDNNDMPGI